MFHTNFDDVKELWLEIEQHNNACAPAVTFSRAALWHETLVPGQDVAVCSVYDKDLCIGLYPFYVIKKTATRILECHFDYDAIFSTPIVRKGYEERFPELFARELRNSASQWDMMNFYELYSFDPVSGALTTELFSGCGMGSEETNKETVYTIDMNQPFEEYYRKQMSKNALSNYRAKSNRMKKAGGYETVLLQGREALDSFEEFVELEDSGWKGEEGTSLKKMPSVLAFYTAFAKELSEQDALLMFQLRFQGQVIAADFGFVSNGVYHEAKRCYSEVHNQYSPSNILTVEKVRILMEERTDVQLTNMFPVAYGYKQRYSSSEHTSRNLKVYSPNLKMRFLYPVYRLKKLIQRWKAGADAAET